MLIHQNLAGRVIGKQGVKVKELKEVFNNVIFKVLIGNRM